MQAGKNGANASSFIGRGDGHSRSVPIIFQSEGAECGLACLAMASSFYGNRLALSDLRRKFSISLKGTTLKALADMAHALGFHARAVRLEPNELVTLRRGAVLHWNLQHYVVFDRCSRSRVIVNDPARGRLVLTWAQFSRHFTGVALELDPGYMFERKAAAPTLGVRQVIGRPKGMGAALTQLVALSIVVQLIGILVPLVSQLVIDDAIARADMDLLFVLGAALLGLQVTTSVLGALRSFVLIYVSNQLSFGLESNLLRHLLHQPVAWLEKRHMGDLSSRFASLKPVEQAVTQTGPTMVIQGLSLLFALGLMIAYSPLMTGLEVASLAILLGVKAATFPHIKRSTQEIVELEARLNSTFLETLRAVRTFKLFNAEAQRVAIWQNERTDAINASVRLQKFQAWGGLGTGILAALQGIVVWYIGAKMVITGSITLGMLIAFKAYADQFNSSSIGIVSGLFTFKALRVSLDRLSDIVLSKPEVVDGPVLKERDRSLKGDLEVRAVSYRYGDHDPWILQDVSFRIPAGSFVCIVGPSGQGKTTLFKLLLGFEAPTQGQILFDGTDLVRLGASTVRASIGAVLQDDQLLSGTISENISFFDAEADPDRIEHAAVQANIDGEIMALPMGYRTFVGDMGSSLSSGQRQRILLARALYRRPQILLLDEGTSNLDTANEAAIMDAIERMPITRIAITHSDTFKVNPDIILRVEKGTILVERSITTPLSE